MYRSEKGWIQAYKDKDALWMHGGDPRKPHAELTSGRHSNGFFNSRNVIPDEALLREAASDLITKLIALDPTVLEVDRVVGPETGATKLAEFLADIITDLRGRKCEWSSPVKIVENGITVRFEWKDSRPKPGEKVLLCEDVITTGGSITLVEALVELAHATAILYFACLVNRSSKSELHRRRLVALIDRHMPMWLPADCPLCKQGSIPLRPKGENWAKLTA